ncbi:MAG: nuclear transport factor 2 family protein [Gallionella sp.]|nr:nuclear transport factor 2 family protein [Gallionella sp.]
MTTTAEAKRREKVVTEFFEYLKAIHSGNIEAIDKMLALWDDEGVVKLIGLYPYSGEFVGVNAISVLYHNVARSAGMPVRLKDSKLKTTLGPRKFEIESIHSIGNKVVATWRTEITTKDKVGFEMSGGDTFYFKEGKISRDLCTMSTRPAEVQGFKLGSLSVNDIGRLALAAWAVV